MPLVSTCTIRRLQQADVHAILRILRNARTEYGLATRVEDVLEASDYALFDTYRRRCRHCAPGGRRLAHL